MTDHNQNHRAYSYTRFSTPEQALGDSERRQTAAADAWAKRHNVTLDTSLELHDDGKSAFHGDHLKRGCLGKFLEAVETGVVPRGSILLVENVDRLTRAHPFNALDLVMGLLKADITIVTLSPERVHTKGDSWSLLQIFFDTFRGHAESERKSDMIKKQWLAKRAETAKTGTPLTGQCPKWLALNKAGTGFDLLPERAAVVRRIFKMALQGIGKGSIAQTFNTEGMVPWGPRRRKKKKPGEKVKRSKVKQPDGKHNGWHDSYIQKILHNPACVGEYQPHKMEHRKRVPVGGVIKDYFPSVVDRETFNKTALKKYTNTPGRVGKCLSNLFSGLVIDGYSGSSMLYTAKFTKKRGSDRWVYLTTDERRKNPKARKCVWQYQEFESLVLTFLCEIQWGAVSPAKQRPVQRETEADTLRAEIGAIAKKLDKLAELATCDAPPRRLVEEMRALEEKQSSKRDTLKILEAEMALATDAARVDESELKQLVRSKSDLQSRIRLREELRRIIDRITVWPYGLDEKDAVEIGDEFTRMLATKGAPMLKIEFRKGLTRWLFVLPNGQAMVLNDAGTPIRGDLVGDKGPDFMMMMQEEKV